MEIQEALGTLDPDHAGHWTSEGAPRVDVVSGIVGRPLNRIDIENAAPDFDRDKARELRGDSPPKQDPGQADGGPTPPDAQTSAQDAPAPREGSAAREGDDGAMRVRDGAHIRAGEDQLGELVPKDYRCWLYHRNCPKGRLVEGRDTVARMLNEGWVDHPGKIRRSADDG